MKPLRNMRGIDMVFYTLIVSGALINIYVYATLPDAATCTIHYANGLNGTYPKSVCTEIHSHIREGDKGLAHEEVIEALNKPACPVCVEYPEPEPCPDCPDCPVCKPQKPCPICRCPKPETVTATTTSTTGCPEQYVHCISGQEYMQFKNLQAGDKAACYQGGFLHAKKRVYDIFDLR